MCRIILLALIGLLPTSLLASDIISCHCFQDRVYNPDKPGAAAEYVLATSRNSFISALFNIPKKTIVAARMRGTSGVDLWLAGYLSTRSTSDLQHLLQRRQVFSDWNELLLAFEGFPESLDSAIATQALKQKSIKETVKVLVDLQVVDHLGLSRGAAKTLRKQGGSNQELILVALLAQLTGTEASAILQKQQSQAIPWDMLIDQLGIKPKQLDLLIRQLVVKNKAS